MMINVSMFYLCIFPLSIILPIFSRYLGYNCISVVEGLENCSNLEVFHVQNQSLPPGGMMYFDPRCAAGIQVTIQLFDENIFLEFYKNM